MYKRYYDGYGPIYQRPSGSGEVIIPRGSEAPKKTVEDTPKEESIAAPSTENMEFSVSDGEVSVAAHKKSGLSSFGNIGKLLDDIAIDDIILFGVILLVLKDSSDDPLLIIILTVIFLAGILDD